MAYITAKVAVGAGTQYATIHGAEKIGPNLIIHRTVEKAANGFEATGKTWSVSMVPVGMSIVEDIPNRLQARMIARRLLPAIAAFRADIERQRAQVEAGTVFFTPYEGD